MEERDENTVTVDGKGVLHGDGSPGEPETAEQGAVRTGRALPEHPGDEDSAGLTPEATAARVEQTEAQRAETLRVAAEQKTAADGDAPGGVRA